MLSSIYYLVFSVFSCMSYIVYSYFNNNNKNNNNILIIIIMSLIHSLTSVSALEFSGVQRHIFGPHQTGLALVLLAVFNFCS